MKKTVMTLDAGGTNFVFSAFKDANEIIEPIRISVPQQKDGKTLEDVLNAIIEGFKLVESKLEEKPVAISFAFPGPAEYELGIIGDLQNLPLFRGGVALGPMLEEIFKIPVFINNDGDLFAYGEAIGGLLPFVNKKLEEVNSPKRYRNLFGVTLGTGFGGGIVSDKMIYPGDNSAQGEINRFSDRFNPDYSIEESTSIKAIKRLYSEYSGVNDDSIEPKDVYDIALGNAPGNKEAALRTFKDFAVAVGCSLANAASLTDGLVVIGGGLSNAYPLFLDDVVAEMNKPFKTNAGDNITRMEVEVYNLENESDMNEFLKGSPNTVKVPFSDKTITYDSKKRIGVGISKLGTEKAISLGAYYYAINKVK